ncbi:molybdopterin-guanine dinucleotide biosynthesis protein B [Sporomusa sp.]|jgi:molybdopterin-guanine dinucleotide biosynthesis protein B|uniref:molybdopterin-guanine dinucleotide biosynthesis protein B n=1 Tax=Sporomusa sp. TaxID=2078658 RepID=UPI002BE20303|nr:molybdopterin-guanine dinucleotide biosynthesis protein B [Sporomusa sp.]MDF2873723.1 mobB: molybdopterin-guanine dinucleotide biosynthesis protein [Sporomusa sp.]HWR08667.1 molybdopterin-guanine dinucleotide biosynthesis protein B [Sporomusa sp.]
MIPIISVVGRSNSGKTTYLVKLIAELKRRGHKVAVIKHHHNDFEIDLPGKDTWRHAQAGADTVCLVSPYKVAMIKKTDQELSLDQVAGSIDNVDIIITEGYKQENKPKIEVYRHAAGNEPLGVKPELLAVVSDTLLYSEVPHFQLDDPSAMAALLELRVLNNETSKD